MNASTRLYCTLSVALASLAGCAGGSSGSVVTAPIPPETTRLHKKTFAFTGAKQEFKVPDGVRSIAVDATGAAGIGWRPRKGGLGGRTVATIPVHPGKLLYVFVGGQGQATNGGFNGGAQGCPASDGRSWGGGGASDVRSGGMTLEDRVLVAGGGGGQGEAAEHGGNGGGLTGGTGGGGPPDGQRGRGGLGGTQTQGGSGGEGGYWDGRPGSPGTLGAGGNGGDGGTTGSSGSAFIRCGGGGGGGYYGGGGGGSSSRSEGSLGGGSAGGGGGGSSYAESVATGITMWQGWKDATGNGVIIFRWK